MDMSKQIIWTFLLLFVCSQLQADNGDATVSIWASHYNFDSSYNIDNDEAFGGSFSVDLDQHWSSELVYEAGELSADNDMDTIHFDALYHLNFWSANISHTSLLASVSKAFLHPQVEVILKRKSMRAVV